MFFHHHKEACGRYALQPNASASHEDNDYNEQEAEPIQLKIENLRTKITLQERYNVALSDSIAERTDSTYATLRNKLADIFNLRLTLNEAIDKEKWAVNNALRTHRLFQLALQKCAAQEALEWMDDKLFDNAKILNDHLDRLINKRRKLNHHEEAVCMLEKLPVPGSFPWEVKMEEKMKAVIVNEAKTKMKLECARTLHVKYKTIRNRLVHEESMYQPILRNLQGQYTFQANELKNLERMLGHAKKFAREANRTLEQTEKSCIISRKQRREQISRMRKETQRMVWEENVSLQKETAPARSSMESSATHIQTKSGNKKDDQKSGFYGATHSLTTIDNEETKLNERLASKHAVIETYNEQAAMLVNVMKIPNLIHIPKRMETVIGLRHTLEEERRSKEQLKDNLIKQRDQLLQLQQVIKFTGEGVRSENELVVHDFEKSLEDVKEECERIQKNINEDNKLMVDCQLGVEAIIERIDGLGKAPTNVKNATHLISVLPMFLEKVQGLVNSLKEAKKSMSQAKLHTIKLANQKLTQNKLQSISSSIPRKFVRVGESLGIDDNSDEEEFEDLRVPSRNELKLKSARILEQGLLKRGLQVKQDKLRKPLRVAQEESALAPPPSSAESATNVLPQNNESLISKLSSIH